MPDLSASNAILVYFDTNMYSRIFDDQTKSNIQLENATQFIVLIERGKGDTVQEIADYWGNTGIEDIHNQIRNWKASVKVGWVER